ncbi:MAG: glycosyltransferase family 4 protein [Candidatus Peribacteraceae bacterium]|jgi:glycosyltransferase involved in cell wall biosynthesis|nr:glycosyltransferase family 4 protein [Candidatus Peribacteraceae bacterium]
MHVCVLLNVLDPFKGGNHLPLFAVAADTQFTIVCNRSKCSTEDLPKNVKVVEVPGRIGQYYYGIADFLFARSVLKKYPTSSDFWSQFDVIHLNQTMGPALKKLKEVDVPLLFLIHHPVTADKEVSGWILKYAPLIQFQRSMCKTADQIATVSETMKKRIASDYGVTPEKISVVYNGVDGDAFTLTKDTECEFDVIALGSFIHPRKGFPYLLKVYTKLAASGKRIADVGRRSQEQQLALQSIQGVTVLGMVDADTLIHLVRHSRVLISTSLFEGFGLSLIEALACGHPAFAFGVGAVPEVLGSIDETLIITPKDTDAMVSAVEAYMTLDAKEREERGQNYRKLVLERYSLEKSASSLQGLYSQIAA